MGIELDIVDAASWEKSNIDFSDPLVYNKLSDTKSNQIKTEDITADDIEHVPPEDSNILLTSKKMAESHVPFLKKPEYIVPSKQILKPIEKELEEILGEKEETVSTIKEKSLEEIKDEIEASFADIESRKYIKHPTSKDATILEEWDIIPDDELWGNEYILLQHDPNQKNSYYDESIVKTFAIGNDSIAAYLIPNGNKITDNEGNITQDYLWKRHFAISYSNNIHTNGNFLFYLDPSTLDHSEDAKYKVGVAKYIKVDKTIRFHKSNSMIDHLFEKPDSIKVKYKDLDEEQRKNYVEKLKEIS